MGNPLAFVWNYNGHTEYFTGAEGPEGTFYSKFDVDISTSDIHLEKVGWSYMLSGASLTIQDYSGAISDFTNVSLTSVSGVPIDINDVSFDTDSITVDFSKTTWDDGEDFTLGITFDESGDIPGDVNKDGYVGSADLDIVRSNWEQGGSAVSDFMGNSLEFVWNYNGHTEYFTGAEGPEGTFYGKFDVDISASDIRLERTAWGYTLDGVTLTIQDHDGAISDFADVSLTTVSGVPIDMSDVSFDTDSITVDLSNTTWNEGEDFTLGVTFSGGGTGDDIPGDVNGDGFVGSADLDMVRAHWCQGTPPASTAVPEPSAGVLLLLLAAVAMMRSSKSGKCVRNISPA